MTLGAMIPKLHADKISPSEARSFLSALNSSEEFREACLNMGYFATDLPVEERQERARTCFELLLATTDPPADKARSMALGGSNLNSGFVKHFGRKLYTGTWAPHVSTKAVTSTGIITGCAVSHELRQRVLALEAFWHVPGYILAK